MTDDLVKRLRNEKMGCNLWCEYYDGITTIPLCIEAADHIEKLGAALRNIAEGDIPRKVTTPFRDDGQPSKHDRCEHGSWFYEDCGCCIEDYAREALEGKDG